MMTDSALLDNTRVFFGRHVDTPIATKAAEREAYKTRGVPSAEDQAMARSMKAEAEKAEFENFVQRAHMPKPTFGNSGRGLELTAFSTYAPASSGAQNTGGGDFGRVDARAYSTFGTPDLSHHASFRATLQGYDLSKTARSAAGRSIRLTSTPRGDSDSPRPWL